MVSASPRRIPYNLQEHSAQTTAACDGLPCSEQVLCFILGMTLNCR